MATMDFHVVDGSKFDIVMSVEEALSVGEIGVKSVPDMVRQLETKCAGGDLIGELRIVGHGNENGQYFGGDWINDYTVHSYAAYWTRLRKLFDTGKGLVTLGGCKVGQAELLLVKLSKLLDVPVRGFRTFQNPVVPGDEGGETRCTPYACARTTKGVTIYDENATNAFSF
jgi:hypothetical protein